MKLPKEGKTGSVADGIIPVAFLLAFAILHFVCSTSQLMPRLFESVVSTKAMVGVAGGLLLFVLVWVCHGVGGVYLASRSVLFPPLALLLAIPWVSSLVGDYGHFGPYEMSMELSWGLWILAAFHSWRGRNAHVWMGSLALGALLITFSCNLAHAMGLASERIRSGGEIADLGFLKHMLLRTGFDFPFYNCNFNAAFLLAPVTGILLAWKFRVSRDPLWAVACVLALLAIPLGMLLSKAAMLVLVLGALCLWLGPKLRDGIPARSHRLFALLLALATVSGVALTLVRLSKSEDFMLGSSAGARMEMWQGVVSMVSPEGPRMKPTELSPYPGPTWRGNLDKARRLLLGWGPGAYPAVSAASRPSSYYAGSYTSDYSEHPHSSLMSFLFDGGLLGLMAGLWFFLRLFFLQHRLTRIEGREGGMARVLLGVSLCMAAYSLVSVEGHYSEMRVWWALVIGGTLALEMGHRKLGVERPREFALGFTMVFIVVALGVLGRFVWVVIPRTQALSKLRMARDTLPSPSEIERIATAVERACLLPEGRTFTCMNSVVGLKDAALLRENEVGRAQSQMAREDPTLGGRWRKQAFHNMWEAVRMAPDFSDLSRLYGEMLWKLAEEYSRTGKSILKFEGREMEVDAIKTLAESWIHRAIIKGDQDALVFDTLRVIPGLADRMGQRILDHPIFTEVFRRRAPDHGIRLPLRFNYAFYLLQKGRHDGAVDEALAVVPSILRDLPNEQAWPLCQGLGEALLARRVDGALWGILERGGPTPLEDRERIMSRPLYSAWFLEILRDRLFTGVIPDGWKATAHPTLRDEAKIRLFSEFLAKGPPPPR